jgi:hypothetical protein
MKIRIDPVIAGRIKNAWDKLSPDQRNRIAPMVMSAHQQAVTASQSLVAPSPNANVGHALPLLFSAISNDQDGVADSLDVNIIIGADGGGEIWGTGKYEQLDPGWLLAGAEWLEHFIVPNHPFSTKPADPIKMPDNVQIGLAGDWGTGDWRNNKNPAPSTDVGIHMNFLQPHLTIHLGDVYYAGTGDEEEQLLVKIWPKGSMGSLALNSNHEMYSGAGAYFNAIGSSPFDMQAGCSYFALYNNNWVIVGLDSAYYSDRDGLYRDGALFPSSGGHQEQLDFLRTQANAAADTHKKMILLTHHNGIAQDASAPTLLWSQVMSAFPPDAGPDYWYWGHVHLGAAYQNQKNGTKEVNCRCCGHGGLPCAAATEMENQTGVLWYEKVSAKDPDFQGKPDNLQRVLNGFAMLYLDGPTIQEVFYNENGGVAWDPKPRPRALSFYSGTVRV